MAKTVSTVNGNTSVPQEDEQSSGVFSTIGVRVIQTIIFMYDIRKTLVKLHVLCHVILNVLI